VGPRAHAAEGRDNHHHVTRYVGVLHDMLCMYIHNMIYSMLHSMPS
jgi:hypothetical protein